MYGGWKLLSSNRSPESSGFSLNICSTRAWVGNLNINVVHQHLLNPCLKAPRARPACAPSPARSQPSLLRAVVSGHSQGEGEAHLENCCIFKKKNHLLHQRRAELKTYGALGAAVSFFRLLMPFRNVKIEERKCQETAIRLLERPPLGDVFTELLGICFPSGAARAWLRKTPWTEWSDETCPNLHLRGTSCCLHHAPQ